MFPNPQDALPLPPRPSLERYRKIAKDLVKACKGAGDLPSADDGLKGSPDAVGDWAYEWAESWVDDLVRLSNISFEPHMPVNSELDAWLEAHGSRAEPRWHWWGERPRRGRRIDSES